MNRRLMAAFATIACVLASHAVHAQQLRDPKIASRALDDKDMTKYVAILGELTKVRKGIKSISSPAGMQEFQAKVKACDAHGWGTLDYSAVDLRMMTAQQHIKMEKTVPVPADKAADVALAKKWADRIAAAKK